MDCPLNSYSLFVRDALVHRRTTSRRRSSMDDTHALLTFDNDFYLAALGLTRF
jgi:hypothetical protein